jgi:hypothetical protein
MKPVRETKARSRAVVPLKEKKVNVTSGKSVRNGSVINRVQFGKSDT